MSNYYKKLFSLIIAVLVVAIAAKPHAQERDPFAPSGGAIKTVQSLSVGNASDSTASPQASLSPITAYKTNSYKVVGVLISSVGDKKLAAVKALNGVDYIVKVGDEIGDEEGKVTKIELDAITIKTSEQEIKIPVSNKIEVSLDKAKNK